MSRAEYERHWRRTSPRYELAKAGNAARTRALRRLGEEHPERLTELVNEERAAAGLRPLGSSPVGRPAESHHPRTTRE